MQATPSITAVFMVEMPRPISLSGKMPRPCVITMVLEAEKKPMTMMTATGSQTGGWENSASREQNNDDQRAADRDALAGVEPAVEGAKGEHAGLVGDHGAEQDVAGRDRAEAMHLAQTRRPTGPVR